MPVSYTHLDVYKRQVYTHVDRGALHVRYAEEADCISESPEDTSYLKPELILSIAKRPEPPFIRDTDS